MLVFIVLAIMSVSHVTLLACSLIASGLRRTVLIASWGAIIVGIAHHIIASWGAIIVG